MAKSGRDGRPRAYFRLTRAERGAIERALDKGEGCRQIARDLGRSPSTVVDEVTRNRTVQRGPRRGERVSEPPADACALLLRWPRVCNGCRYFRSRSCNRPWRCEYSAARAQALADEELRESRRGVDCDEAGMAMKLAAIRSDIARGLSPQQIARARSGELGVSPSTIYRWVSEGYGGMSDADLRRKVGYKPRRKDPARHASHHGPQRSHEAFCALPEAERDLACEMDTVCGRATDSQCLLTLYLRGCSLQAAILMPSKTREATVAELDRIERALGSREAFEGLLGLILTDNGGEFEDEEGIERSVFGGRRCRVFYCDPRQSQQKPFCERNHEEIRKLLPKGRGISFDDLDAADAAFVSAQVNSDPRPRLMGLTPCDMLRAARPGECDAALAALGVSPLGYGELDLTLGAVNRERAGRGLPPLA